jgi:hypothetical protein
VETTLAELKRSVLYSEQLGIDLSINNDEELFHWFLASLMYGGHISETIASHTYQAFAEHDLLTPHKIIEAGWDYLVSHIMREGGYVRYDGRKSRQVIQDCEKLLKDYQGSLKRLHREATDAADLEARMQAFYGVGPVTANIFLRELRPFWKKANPEPLPVVFEMAAQLDIRLDDFKRNSLTFCRIEAGLIRHRRQLHKGREE